MANSICLYTPLRVIKVNGRVHNKDTLESSQTLDFLLTANFQSHFSITFFMDEKFHPMQLTTAKENGEKRDEIENCS